MTQRNDTVWSQRGLDSAGVVWPAIVVDQNQPEGKVLVQFLGPKPEQSLVAAANTVAFNKHSYDHFTAVMQHTPDFDEAVKQAIQREIARQPQLEAVFRLPATQPPVIHVQPPAPAPRQPAVPARPLGRAPEPARVLVQPHTDHKKTAHSSPVRGPTEAYDVSPPLAPVRHKSPGGHVARGTRVRIHGTDVIHHKLRDYAGTEAVIVEMPQHPNTWYGIRLCDGKEVKIRKSAFDVIGGGHRAALNPPKLSLGASSSSSSSSSSRSSRPSYAHEPSASSSRRSQQESRRLPPGLRVMIRRTNETQEKFESYIGQEALIVETPVHPNTWYTLKLTSLPSGETPIIKLHRPAIVTLDEAAPEQERERVRKIALAKQAQAAAAQQAQAQHMLAAQQQLQMMFPFGAPPMLLGADPNLVQMQQQLPMHLIGQLVTINSGDLANETGQIVGFQNGKFQVRLSADEVVSKSPEELEFAQHPPLPQFPALGLQPLNPLQAHVLQVQQQQQQAAMAGLEDDGPDAAMTEEEQGQEQTGGRASKSKPTRTRTRKPPRDLLGKYVMIESGQFKGEIGYVNKTGDGFHYVMKLDGEGRELSGSVMKRSADLRLVTPPAGFEAAMERAINAMDGKEVPILEDADEGMGQPFDEGETEGEGEASSPLDETEAEEAAEELDQDALMSDAEAEAAASELAASATSSSSSSSSGSSRKRKRGLTLTQESWIDRKVCVNQGKYCGEVGTVTKSGHGFYCVDIPNRGEIMKRANELNLYDVNEVLDDAGVGMEPADGTKLRKAAFILMDLMKDRNSSVTVRSLGAGPSKLSEQMQQPAASSSSSSASASSSQAPASQQPSQGPAVFALGQTISSESAPAEAKDGKDASDSAPPAKRARVEESQPSSSSSSSSSSAQQPQSPHSDSDVQMEPVDFHFAAAFDASSKAQASSKQSSPEARPVQAVPAVVLSALQV